MRIKAALYNAEHLEYGLVTGGENGACLRTRIEDVREGEQKCGSERCWVTPGARNTMSPRLDSISDRLFPKDVVLVVFAKQERGDSSEEAKRHQTGKEL